MILYNMKITLEIEKNIIEIFKILYSHTIYHEDIQVTNILIKENENIILIDFEKSLLNENKMILLKKKNEIRYILQYLKIIQGNNND